MTKKTNNSEWVDITDSNNVQADYPTLKRVDKHGLHFRQPYYHDIHTYRLELECSAIDLDAIINEISGYGNVLKIERKKGE